ncbi:hypothetical protein SAMN02910436_02671 [Ruminococcaceae bacterium P7]|nr:hypothetical protein SAMN02910436_02671 [Ruminococcaceae bacterium P7]
MIFSEKKNKHMELDERIEIQECLYPLNDHPITIIRKTDT